MNQKPDTTIICDLCGRKFNLTKETLQEGEVTLHLLHPNTGWDTHQVWMTTLICPCCEKSYPVIMDDERTLPLLDKLQRILAKQVKQVKRGFSPDPGLERKRRELSWKLDFKRQKLADEYNGAFYQLEDGTMEQLDYRYHAR